MGNFNPQDLANLAWAFAKAGLPDAQLFTALARGAERTAACAFPRRCATPSRPPVDPLAPNALAAPSVAARAAAEEQTERMHECERASAALHASLRSTPSQ